MVSRRYGSFTGSRVIEQQEMELMNVKSVQLIGTIFDDPVLHVALLHRDVWHGRSWDRKASGFARPP